MSNVVVDLNGSTATIRWRVNIESSPRWVSTEVSTVNRSVDNIKTLAQRAYYRADDRGVSPKAAFEKMTAD